MLPRSITPVQFLEYELVFRLRPYDALYEGLNYSEYLAYSHLRSGPLAFIEVEEHVCLPLLRGY